MGVRAYITNLDGERTGQINDGDRILREKSIINFNSLPKDIKQIDELNSDKIKWLHNDFGKFYREELKEILKEMNGTEKQFIVSILPYIAYDSCCIEYENHIPVSINNLSEICDLSERSIYQVINSLIFKSVIAYAKIKKGKVVIVNPWIFSRGTKINSTLKTLFNDYKIHSLKNKMWSDL